MINADCRVGWVDFGLFYIFNKLPLIFVTYIRKVPKKQKKMLDPVTASPLVTTFWVMHNIRVKNLFFTIWTSRVSKDAELYVDFKNINFP
jgi:hypothetical protein